MMHEIRTNTYTEERSLKYVMNERFISFSVVFFLFLFLLLLLFCDFTKCIVFFYLFILSFSCRLSCCGMTDEGCSSVTSALKSNPSNLRELNLSGNKLGETGVKNLSDLLMNPQFQLDKLQFVSLYTTVLKSQFIFTV